MADQLGRLLFRQSVELHRTCFRKYVQEAKARLGMLYRGPEDWLPRGRVWRRNSLEALEISARAHGLAKREREKIIHEVMNEALVEV